MYSQAARWWSHKNLSGRGLPGTMRSPTIRSEHCRYIIKGGSTCHARNPCLPERWSPWSSGLRSPPVAATRRPAHPPARVRGRSRCIRTRACSFSPLAIRAGLATPATRARRRAGLAGRASLSRLPVNPAGRATPAIPVRAPVGRAAPAVRATRARPVLRSARTAWFRASRLRAARAARAIHCSL